MRRLWTRLIGSSPSRAYSGELLIESIWYMGVIRNSCKPRWASLVVSRQSHLRNVSTMRENLHIWKMVGLYQHIVQIGSNVLAEEGSWLLPRLPCSKCGRGLRYIFKNSMIRYRNANKQILINLETVCRHRVCRKDLSQSILIRFDQFLCCNNSD